MELGFVGLGRMGGSMVTRLARGGHRVVAWDPSADATARARDNGADLAASLAELPKALKPPRAVWIMVPRRRADGVDDPGARRGARARRYDRRRR